MEARYKYATVSLDVLTELLKQDGTTKITGMPKDAKIVAISIHQVFYNNSVLLRVWSSEFPIQKDGTEGASLEFKVEKLNPEGGFVIPKHLQSTVEKFAMGQIEEYCSAAE